MLILRGYLNLVGLMFLIFGLYSLINPLDMTGGLGLDASGPHASFELRGIYGGVSLGAAALCLWGSFRLRYARPALWFVIAYMGGYLFGRAYALIADGTPESYFWSFILFEVIVFLGALGLLINQHDRLIAGDT